MNNMVNEPFIRNMQPADINIMSEIARDVMPYAWSRAVFADCFKPDYHGYILTGGEFANQVLGFVIGLIQLNECQLLTICVRQKVMRHGYGRRLLQHMIAYCQQQHTTAIFLECRISNQAAIHFYKAMGFSNVGIRRNYYRLDDGREDAVIMKWEA